MRRGRCVDPVRSDGTIEVTLAHSRGSALTGRMLIAALALTLGLQTAPSEEPLATTVCEIIADPSAFNGRRVAVEGYYRTDWHHGALLVGEDCRRGIFIGPERGSEAALDFAQVYALQGQQLNPNAVRMSVLATFVYDPTETGTFALTHVFRVYDVVELEIDPALIPDAEILARLTAAASE